MTLYVVCHTIELYQINHTLINEMETTRPTKFEIFTQYNKLRAAARKAGDVKQIERLNKVLGILQSKDYYQAEKQDYQPDESGCSCKDWEFRYAKKRAYAGPCKHMLAAQMTAAILANRHAHEITNWIKARYLLESEHRI